MSVSDRILCKRINKFFIKITMVILKNIHNTVLQKIVKYYHLIIMKKKQDYIVININ